MTQKIFEDLAAYYDLLYSDKNYQEEADFIEKCFQSYANVKSILEIGCGTGNYTKMFLDKGYSVTGIDISQQMIDIAQKKCKFTLLKADVKDTLLVDTFDCCLSLFAVMGYITDNAGLTKALRNIRSHLTSNGVFVFDVWNGLAVIRNLPENRLKELENKDYKILRFAHPTLKAAEHICQVDYKLMVENKKTSQFSVIDETHRMRFFFPKEIEYYLETCGFQLLKICPFRDFNGKVDETVWNMTVIAKVA